MLGCRWSNPAASNRATTEQNKMPRIGTSLADEARATAYATPLADFQPHAVEHFTSDTLWPWFERLRAEDPVHYTARSEYGPYWSITRFDDIVACEGDVARLSSSSKQGGITLFEPPDDPEQRSETRASFISLDPPRHDTQRRAAAPMFSTPSLAELEPLIRSRAAEILDELPIGETFDFVDRVAVELTSQMLATLFDFPFEHRRRLPQFSDYLLSPRAEEAESRRQQSEMFITMNMFIPLWNARRGAQRRDDLISLLANDPATDGGDNPQNYMSNIILLIVAGSDTTRHSITGGLLALHQHPGEYAKLRANPALLESAVPEIIRWQSPVAYMRRTALTDLEIGGKTIRKGGQPRRARHRAGKPVHHRPRAAAGARRLRVRHPPLSRPETGRDAASGGVGGDSAALSGDRGGGRADAAAFQLRQGLQPPAGAHTRLKRSSPEEII